MSDPVYLADRVEKDRAGGIDALMSDLGEGRYANLPRDQGKWFTYHTILERQVGFLRESLEAMRE